MISQLEIEVLKTLKVESLDDRFKNACTNENFELVRYLSSTNELNYKPSQEIIDSSFCWSCDGGKLAIIKFLLLSPEIKKHANIYGGAMGGIAMACLSKKLDVLEYLIFDFKVKKTKEITALITNHSVGNSAQPALDMFKKRYESDKLVGHLKASLPINSGKKTKNKI